MSLKDIGFAVDSVKEFEEYLGKKNLSIESAGLDVLKEYLSLLIHDGKNSRARETTLIYILLHTSLCEGNNLFLGITVDFLCE